MKTMATVYESKRSKIVKVLPLFGLFPGGPTDPGRALSAPSTHSSTQAAQARFVTGESAQPFLGNKASITTCWPLSRFS